MSIAGSSGPEWSSSGAEPGERSSASEAEQLGTPGSRDGSSSTASFGRASLHTLPSSLCSSTLFRSAYGATNGNVQAAASSCGLKAVVLWKGSTNDGRFDLQDGTQLTPGDVVLMHFRTDLLVDLQKVFEVCKQQGFAIARLEDYLPA